MWSNRDRTWNAELKFWRFVEKSNSCWLWIGRKSPKGYGELSYKQHRQRAHRVAWQMANGPIPDGMIIRHSCDNPPCVRLGHLLIGTIADNNRDKAERGRIKGAQCPWAKLTMAQATAIRGEYSNGHITQTELGNKFGVSQDTISRIVNGLRYSNESSASDVSTHSSG
jgi:DNA-binding XRE family transcriptional regulator